MTPPASKTPFQILIVRHPPPGVPQAAFISGLDALVDEFLTLPVSGIFQAVEIFVPKTDFAVNSKFEEMGFSTTPPLNPVVLRLQTEVSAEYIIGSKESYLKFLASSDFGRLISEGETSFGLNANVNAGQSARGPYWVLVFDLLAEGANDDVHGIAEKFHKKLAPRVQEWLQFPVAQKTVLKHQIYQSNSEISNEMERLGLGYPAPRPTLALFGEYSDLESLKEAIYAPETVDIAVNRVTPKALSTSYTVQSFVADVIVKKSTI
ncbi:hypothetical protein HMN09_00368600 [Mycena chlorophos]|uniref:Uncharacterized protein n=1 Tax=Mycena chlorophos TaxID=658473 RepID=A0A8H6TKY7_MYCCL|nr:hypothetical protein HMN09_00368600 [Mycena chlorophos]